MGPCNELVFLGGVERRERSKTTARRGGQELPGVQQQEDRGPGGSAGALASQGASGGGGGRDVSLHGLLAVHGETRERELSLRLCLRSSGRVARAM